MPTFQSKKFLPRSYQNTLAAAYRAKLARHPFLLFGLPFVTTIVAGSFFLTPATAVRYEKHDRKTHMLDTQTALGLRGHGDGERDLTQEERIAGGTRRGAGSLSSRNTAGLVSPKSTCASQLVRRSSSGSLPAAVASRSCARLAATCAAITCSATASRRPSLSPNSR